MVRSPARLAEGGRLVAITGANLSPDNPAWREEFIRLQERGRVAFSAAIDGRVYARHGTSVDTRLTVIDRIPAESPAAFPVALGIAPDAATLLDWAIRHVPARPPVAISHVNRAAPPAPRVPAKAGARVLLRRQPRIGFDPIRGGGGKPRLRGRDGRDVGVTGLHVQPRLAVGDVLARQALILLLMKNQMLRPTAPTARRVRPPGENAPPGMG
jgi:hypothetical protein